VGKGMDGFHGNYQYKIIERIGKGGFGYVDKIELVNVDGHQCGYYARKCLLTDFGDQEEEFRRRFEREVVYQANCIHTNIASIYLYSLSAPQPWFIMDLADGDLQNDIDNKSLTMAQKINALNMILKGVEHIHDRKYLHRDIKPSNVLRFNNIYKVSDFGLVKNSDSAAESEVITKITTLMGTQKYWGPEVISAAMYSVQSDIFSLGIVMEEMVFPDTSNVHKVIKKSTERKPLDRYPSVREMREDFIAATKETGK
jgi:serine/threonine protein kinase